MDSVGVVREFHPEDGWGVIDSAQVPGGCWVSFAAIRVDGFRELTPGQPVRFAFEGVADQDGYRYRATEVRPLDGSPAESGPADQGSAAYRSTLQITFDPPESAP
jgi:CspA family cold shock protein